MRLSGLVFKQVYVHIMKPFLYVTQAIVVRNAKVRANTDKQISATKEVKKESYGLCFSVKKVE